MANSQINIASSNSSAIKDAYLPKESKTAITFTSGTNTWVTIATIPVNVINSSADVLVMVNIGLDTSAAAVGSVLRWQKNGSDLDIATTAGSRISGHSNIYRTALQTSNTLYYLDTGVSSGVNTYTLQYQANTSVTVGVNRDTTEASTTARTLTTAMAIEL